ncbi:bifunctional 3-(3-hydroxy-phenyl)propionate/3-hydroxycinnamic acid hydroxylase [Nocardioides sp. BP30]|uniref:bifunctional 3-(3-hydroxy-phenyl)propionate/3-hydroxycinnamic acid hydroxylase n=1 Tax=Nocardioides sp. BP30 TaxID=3036374 RepID=UPI00246986E2|nr:bifunctional 3-(3-hydroxy-phenyl)propionate/3-hydroxycinnamic acid hydroxylase [Nocardioides sp. BP30]WGL54061.1 bifunctional 3-(3-hydroxy-phenyl)propionate/3-hydroxycinnamic acid hydroxylase [Nocardioides sp. BP30]
MPEASTTDILIVGAGPCGITLANLLALWGVRAVVLDAEPDLYPHPRAVGIDDESLRTFQKIGVVDRLLEDMLQNTPIRYYTSWGRMMAHVEPSVRPFGWPRRNTFLQPLFEATLRDRLEEAESVELRLGATLVDYEQGDDRVRALVEGADGTRSVIGARYLVGADGGRSTVRRVAGIELIGTTAPQKWLVVDVADDDLDAPYSAVHCDPERPVLVVPLPYGHRRFEFKLLPGDDEEALTDPDRALRELIRPRYPATSRPRVLRSAVYWHHSRTAERFRDRRVFLAGDAAHLQPPFFGQGMNSGIRDVTNLAWKLALVLRGQAGDALLDSYDAERRGHARTMVQFATRMGELYTPRNVVTERLRDVAFRAAQRIPGARDYILQMKYKPMPRYRRGAVLPYTGPVAGSPVGTMFGQPEVETAAGARVRLDAVLGTSFAVLGLHVDPAAALGAAERTWWRTLGARFVHVTAPRSGAGPEPGERRTRPAAETVTETAAETAAETIRVEDVDGGFRDWMLRRPGDEVIVLRPDGYLAAICTRHELDAVSAQLRALLS